MRKRGDIYDGTPPGDEDEENEPQVKGKVAKDASEDSDVTIQAERIARESVRSRNARQ